MATRELLQRTLGLIFLLTLLTACGDGNGINFTIQGSNWPWPWTRNAEFFADKTVSESVTVAGHRSIWIDTVNGEIEVIGQPDTNAVVVTANLQVGSDSQVDAQAGLAQLDFNVMDGYDEISVQTLQPKFPQGRQYRVRYTITLPSSLAIDVNQVNGHIAIKDIESSIQVKVANGNVNFSNILDDVTVDVGNGRINGKLTHPPNGEIKLATGNGAIDLRIPTTTSAAFSAQVDNGAITYDNLQLTNVQQTSQSLQGSLGDGTWLIDLKTRNGDIGVIGIAP